jgi:hypothetical protein
MHASMLAGSGRRLRHGLQPAKLSCPAVRPHHAPVTFLRRASPLLLTRDDRNGSRGLLTIL